jgi:hypothetical protein
MRSLFMKIGSGAAVVALLCVGLAAASGRVADSTADPSTPLTTTPTADTGIKQAKWSIKTFPSAALKKLSPQEKLRIRSQKPRLEELAQEVYDALFLASEAERADVLNERFTARAARALLSSGAGTTDQMSLVKTISRKARIGIDASSARQAAATVKIRARAFVDDELVRINHQSTLWLQRIGSEWMAIAFEVKQEPAK